MKQFSIQAARSQNRKTVSDLKLKKSLQYRTQQLFKINNSYKMKPAKLSPIIGQITVIPIKPQYAIVKQMLLGKQVVNLKRPNGIQKNLKTLKSKEQFRQKQFTENKSDNNKYLSYFQESELVKQQKKNSSIILEQNNKIQQKLQGFLIRSQKILGDEKKIDKKLKTLPKLQSQPKFMTQRLDRPLLSSIDPNLKSISALHFFIQQHSQKTPIIAHRSKTKIEVASLTKIMTFYTIYKICLQANVNIKQTQIKIQERMTEISGTSACLQHNQIYTIQQLLYGMMLPSGNDASTALAIWGGRTLISNNAQPQNQIKKFIQRMNFETQQLKMFDSTFGNCHGLPHRNNRTTCQDIAKLCSECLQIPLFKQIVSTKIYKFKVYDPLIKRKIALQWENTNKLLRRPGFIGIKTGITVTAGPCLASAYQFLNKTYIVVIAKCSKPSRRFKQTRKLLVHCLQRIDHGRPLQKQQQLILKKLNKRNDDIDSDYSEDEQKFNFSSFSQQQIQKRAKTLTQI